MSHRKRLFILVSCLAAVFAVVVCSRVAQSQSKDSVGIDFVKIAPDELTMGCSDGDNQCSADEKPAHKVKITKAFEMGKYELTQAQWKSVMNSNPSAIKGDNHPVENVARTDAEDFLAKLNARNDGYHYRLPTEAEWEYAARAGTKGAYAGPLKDIAWFADNSEDETHAVGTKKPNAWGLYDMEGNVREWVSDTYGANYYSNSPATDPTGPVAGQGGRGGRGGPPDGGPPNGGPRGAGFNAPNGQGGPRGRGGPQGRGGPPPDGPGPDGPGGPCPVAPPQDQQREIDCLRNQVAILTQQLQVGNPGGGPGPGPGGRGGPGGPGGNLPVMRGGAWDNFDSFQRVSARYNYYGPTLRTSDIGFRVVREPVAK